MLAIIKYYLVRILLKTFWHKQLFEVPIDKCINPFGFAFKNGWHHLIKFLNDNTLNSSKEIRLDILKLFYSKYLPDSTIELVTSAGMHSHFNEGFFLFPWGNFKQDFPRNFIPKDKNSSRFCGPFTNSQILNEAHQTLALNQKIIKHGYNPWKYPFSFIGGVFLRKKDDYRFVVLQGNHRVACLSFLGIDKIVVRKMKGYFTEINIDDAKNWYYVKIGKCTLEDAKKYFNSFFILNGNERAEQLTLIIKN